MRIEMAQGRTPACPHDEGLVAAGISDVLLMHCCMFCLYCRQRKGIDAMFKSILVPTDGSELSQKAADVAIRFAEEAGARIVVISVAEPVPYGALADGAVTMDVAQYERQAQELAQKRVDAVCAAAAVEVVPCQTVTALSYTPYTEIIAAAGQYQCDVIFMASHGRRGLNRLILGSETQKVLAHTTIPVLVIR
jgi:nucleotide-binding universal stress UspA family protein